MSTFKSIKIDPINKPAITAALLKANGASVVHTLRSFETIEQLAADAEVRLLELIGPRARGAGAQLTYTSGQHVAMSYPYPFRATKVVLERGGCGWYLTSVKCATVKPSAGTGSKLFLTPAQHAAAISYVQKKYSVLKPKTDETPKAVAGVDEAGLIEVVESDGSSNEASGHVTLSEESRTI